MESISVWQPLTHEAIFQTVEEVIKQPLSNLLLQRNSYINRVYELEKEKDRQRLIIKFYRPGRWSREVILEEHKFLHDLAEHEIAVIPPLEFSGSTLFSFSAINFEIMPKKGGRALDEFSRATWEELGRLLARVHLVGENHARANRINWRPAVASQVHLQVLENSDYLLPDFKEALVRNVTALIKETDQWFEGRGHILIHGDCHKGNLIHRPGEGIFLVDFDDICLGPPVQDLWMLLPDTPEKSEQEIEWFLKGYETFRPFDRASLKLVPVLRAMRIVHYAAWLSNQFHDPGFPSHFPEAGTKRYWSELIRELQEIVSSIFPDAS
jgi:Ser/Thr protein kinase RdoA (MazF antagonist)